MTGRNKDQAGQMDDNADLRVASKASLRASGQVQSVTRSLGLLNALARFPQGLTLSQVAKMVGLANSTTHRLLTTLQNERYVRFEAERSAWIIGVQAFRVGSTFIRSRDLVATARPFMRRLMMQSGETVSLGVENRGEVIYLAQVETQKMMRAIAGPGGSAHIHASGIGKAILAGMDDETLPDMIASLNFEKDTHRTIARPQEMDIEIAGIRQIGYATDDEEVAIGLRCVAAPVFDEHGSVIAGISVSGPRARISKERISILGPAVAKTALDLTKDLGGTPPEFIKTDYE